MSAPALEHANVFMAGTDGYCAYRIPVIEVTADGTLLAFAEARKYNLGDPGHDDQEIDLVLKRSTDGGSTWSVMTVIEAPGEYWSAANAVTVTDRDTGRTWVIYLRCRPNASSGRARPGTDDIRMLARYSDDGGLAWSDSVDLTEVSRDLGDERWRCTVPGPGGGIQDRQGRLVVPCWKLEPWQDFAMFSADHGESWKRGAPVPGDVPGNENQLVELADGRLLMDFRQRGGDHRWFAESTDGGRTWGAARPGITVSAVACAINRLGPAADESEPGPIVWTGPRGPRRRDLVACVSHDEGQTFGEPRLICESMAAYSDLTRLGDNALGVFWESGEESAYERLTFTRLSCEFLEGE